MWHYVEDYDFYRIEYTLNGYWHKLQLSAWNLDGRPVPEYISDSLKAVIDCIPEERKYR